jgi:hypothetical protein
MSVTPLPDLILYGRPDCGLCAEARELIGALVDERRRNGLPVPRLVERDIDVDPAWQRAYHPPSPVVVRGARRLDLATSAAKLGRLLADVLDPTPVDA